MDNIKKFNYFIFLSTLIRNIGNVFSTVLLYKIGYSIREIILFYFIFYFIGMVVSIFTIYLIGRMRFDYFLIVSSIIYSISFYCMTSMEKDIFNLVLVSIIYSLGTYSYHTVRHYLAINSLEYDKKIGIGNIIIYTNIAIIISSLISGYIGSINSVILGIIIIIISFISIIPLLGFDIKKNNSSIIYYRMNMKKRLFFIFEQGKSVFLLFEPLYIFLFVEKSMGYVGITSSLIGVSSCVFTYFFVRRKNNTRYFKYYNNFLCIILLFKLNVYNKFLMLIIVFIEGILLKIFDIVSTDNLYDLDDLNNIKGYLMVSEIIFCLASSIMCLIFVFFDDIRIMMYMLIIFIFIAGFFIKEKQ